jgi:hypothetical protein
MDDVAIGIDNSTERQKLHEEIVHKFLQTLQDHSYFLKASKYEFHKDQIDFLRFQLGYQVVKVDPTKIGGIEDWPRQLKLPKEV